MAGSVMAGRWHPPTPGQCVAADLPIGQLLSQDGHFLVQEHV